MSIQFFCHYNLIAGEISKISPQAEKDDPNDSNIFVFEIPENIALSMLAGETGPQEWIAIKPQDDTVPQPYELVRRLESAMNKLSRVDGSIIVTLHDGTMTDKSDVHVIVDTVNNLLDVYVRIETMLLSQEKMLEIFMTAKNDYSYLLNSFKIDLTQLKMDICSYDISNIMHSRQRFKLNILPESFSLFATRIFSTYSMEIQNDNPPNE